MRDCTVTCTATADCADGQVCDHDGYCTTAEAAGTCTTGPAPDDNDNNPQLPDAGPAITCPTACTGGCVGGTCTIDCTANGSCATSDVHCPPGMPCRVLCGEAACTKKVVCEFATACEVQCNGSNSCLDDILCGAGACSVSCTGTRSCKRTKCRGSCSCDVSCSGFESCSDPSECPAVSGDNAACRLGNGCTSSAPSCKDC